MSNLYKPPLSIFSSQRLVNEEDIKNTYTTKYEYNQYSEVIKKTDSFGNSMAYEYDAGGLLLQKQVLETGDSIKYSYDEAGNRTAMDDESGTNTFTYDTVGNIVLVTDLKANTIAFAAVYEIVEKKPDISRKEAILAGIFFTKDKSQTSSDI